MRVDEPAAVAAAARGRIGPKTTYASQQAPPGSSSLWAQRYSVDDSPLGRGSFATVSALCGIVCLIGEEGGGSLVCLMCRMFCVFVHACHGQTLYQTTHPRMQRWNDFILALVVVGIGCPLCAWRAPRLVFCE